MGSDALWRVNAMRLVTAIEACNPWTDADPWSDLFAVHASILDLALPYDVGGWIARWHALSGDSNADWGAFNLAATDYGRSSSGAARKDNAATCVATAASCATPPILTDYAPTLTAYREIWSGHDDATSVAEWVSAALYRAGVVDGDDQINNAILHVFETTPSVRLFEAESRA